MDPLCISTHLFQLFYMGKHCEIQTPSAQLESQDPERLLSLSISSTEVFENCAFSRQSMTKLNSPLQDQLLENHIEITSPFLYGLSSIKKE